MFIHEYYEVILINMNMQDWTMGQEVAELN